MTGPLNMSVFNLAFNHSRTYVLTCLKNSVGTATLKLWKNIVVLNKFLKKLAKCFFWQLDKNMPKKLSPSRFFSYWPKKVRNRLVLNSFHVAMSTYFDGTATSICLFIKSALRVFFIIIGVAMRATLTLSSIFIAHAVYFMYQFSKGELL